MRKPRTRRIAFAMVLAALAAIATTVSASAAALKELFWVCRDSKQVCSWFRSQVKPPKGWLVNDDWTNRYKAVVMFPGGRNDIDKPMMYVRAHTGDADLGLDEYVATAQKRWLDKLPDSKIETLAAHAVKGKQPFKVFLYKNPSQPEQAFELTSFMKTQDPKHPGKTFFFQVVMASGSMEALEQARPAFLELLGNL